MADYVEGIKGSKAVVVFGKSTCGFCTRVKKVLVEVCIIWHCRWCDGDNYTHPFPDTSRSI